MSRTPTPGPSDTSKRRGGEALGGVNLELMRILVTGEIAVGVAAAVLSAILKVDPATNLDLSPFALALGVVGALPPFVGSVLLERSGVPFFQKIDQDTKLYVLQVFGAKTNIPVVAAWAGVLALNASLFEELLFRGVIQQFLSTTFLGAVPSLLVTSALFGLAHSPVPGASTYTEALYGLNFGLLYLATGGNLAVPLVAHFVYDLLTFLEVHMRATGELRMVLDKTGAVQPLNDAFPDPPTVARRVRALMSEFKLDPKFVDMNRAVFVQLDLDNSGTIDQRELQLGLRTFGKFLSESETAAVMREADVDGNGELSFDEFLRLITLNYIKVAQVLAQPDDPNAPGPRSS